jgi:N,N'-diacetyllegionaminate synthase
VWIADRPVGPGAAVYIVAEAGVNHDGDPQRALALVDAAAHAGADAVKFQLFRASELVTGRAAAAGYQRAAGFATQREMLCRLELSEEVFAQLAEYCRKRRIAFMATPFGAGDVDRVVGFGAPAIKIGSGDLNNVRLLRRAAETGLPVILSTGAATATEIRQSVEWLRAWGAGDRLILLHCVSCYPAPLEAANLRAIGTLEAEFGVPCGFSDHTTSTQIGAWAVAAGACLLEKHFTLDRRARGPDHAMSLEPQELADYIQMARQAEKALGRGQLGMSELETEVRQLARRSVVSARFLPAGTVLSAEMVTVKRPAGGIPPDRLDELIGRRLRIDVPADTPLSWDMLA